MPWWVGWIEHLFEARRGIIFCYSASTIERTKICRRAVHCLTQSFVLFVTSTPHMGLASELVIRSWFDAWPALSVGWFGIKQLGGTTTENLEPVQKSRALGILFMDGILISYIFIDDGPLRPGMIILPAATGSSKETAEVGKMSTRHRLCENVLYPL